jgi:hypothetical protein
METKDDAVAVLEKIATCLTHIELEDLTKAERHIAAELLDAGIVMLDDNRYILAPGHDR